MSDVEVPTAPDAAAGGSVPPAPEDMAAIFDLTKKKRKTKTTKTKTKSEKKKGDGESDASAEPSTSSGAEAAASSGTIGSVLVQDPATYAYKDELLARILAKLHENNPELTDRKRTTMKPPQLMRVGTKKTLWVNFQEICQMMHRSPEHVLQFTLAELGTEGSIDGNQRLVIRGRYVPKYIESLLRKYIMEYVSCQMCRSPNTTLTRDSVSRLYFVHCQDCGSSRSVAAIRSGFHAATRADRRAARK
jgi:translation initiation factor 2 subunit 2